MCEKNIGYPLVCPQMAQLAPRHVPGTGSRTSNLWIHRPALSPLSHASQGKTINLLVGTVAGRVEGTNNQLKRSQMIFSGFPWLLMN